MDATWVYYVLGAFLAVFLATVGISIYQEDQEGVRKDVESIKEREVAYWNTPRRQNKEPSQAP